MNDADELRNSSRSLREPTPLKQPQQIINSMMHGGGGGGDSSSVNPDSSSMPLHTHHTKPPWPHVNWDGWHGVVHGGGHLDGHLVKAVFTSYTNGIKSQGVHINVKVEMSVLMRDSWEELSWGKLEKDVLVRNQDDIENYQSTQDFVKNRDEMREQVFQDLAEELGRWLRL